MRLILIMLTFLSLSVANARTGTKEIVLTKDNTLVLNQAFTSGSVADLMGQAKALDAALDSGYPIYLFLNTPGGSIQAGLELIEFFKGVNRPVHTVSLFAASMGWQLLQNLGDRYILEYGVIMSHKASGGFRGSFGGDSSQLDSRYGLWLRRLNMLDRKTVERTNGKKTLKQYQSEYDNELWLNGAEAVAEGYADEVVSIKCGAGLDGTNSKIVRGFGFNLKVSFDNCPIRTAPVSISASLRTNKGYMSLDQFMANGGIFGEKCRLRGEKEKKSWRGNKIASVPSELCLMDRKLSLKDIEKSIQSKKQELRNKNGKVVKMSFGGFIQGL